MLLHSITRSLQLEHTGHRSLEALHKHKHTGSDQQYDVSMALLPPVAEIEKENLPKADDDDDFVTLKKKPKFNPEDVKAMLPRSTLSNCTFNVTFGSK